MPARPIALSGGIAATALLGSVGTAQAADFEVNSNAGDNDNLCEPLPNDCTLPDALLAAQSNDNPAVVDQITFASTVTGSIDLFCMGPTCGLPTIDEPLRVIGPGADVLTIDAGGNPDRRLFHISTIANPGSDVTISGLTLTGAVGTSPPGGGAIASFYADLTVSETAIAQNQAINGGGILASLGGDLTIDDSVFSGNNAYAADNANGGAIFSATPGDITIRNTTISGNHAVSTAPSYSGLGGGVHLAGNPATVTVESSTIAGNTTTGVGFGDGGGIFQTYSVGTPLLRNSIVAGNTVSGASTAGPDLYGDFNVVFSLIANPSGATLTAGVPGSNLTGIDPQLQPLGDNGGPTASRALLQASPAVDKGRSFGLSTDQRGSARPSDFLTIPNSLASGGDGADIGAFELNAPAPPRCKGSPATMLAGAGVTGGTPARDVIVGTAGRNLIRGRGGNDVICGLAGRDRLAGGGGRDRLIGGKGRDTLIGGGGRDVLRGGPGRDTQRQ